MKKIERPLLNSERTVLLRSGLLVGAGGFSETVIPAKGEARVSGLAQRVAEGMGTLGTNCGTMSEAAATPALNDLIPRELRNRPRLKAGVT